MKRWTIAALVAIVIVAVAAVLFVATMQSSSGLTNQVKCTDYEVTVYEGSTFTNGSQSFDTVSSVTTFTTVTNYSTTVGYTIANTIGPKAYGLTGELTFTQSCTFVG